MSFRLGVDFHECGIGKYSVRKLVQLMILGCILLTSVSVFAEEPEKMEHVISTGVGIDMDGAKANAIRNAVEQVVGTFVSSETILKNSELISDSILSYSGGYVKESKVLSQGKTPDGLYSVKIDTLVVVTKLKYKLKALNIGIRKVEGDSLFAEATSRVQEQKSGSVLLKEVFSKYPQAAYLFDVGKPRILDTDSPKNKTKILIPLSIRLDDEFMQKLKEVLHQVSIEELENVELPDYRKSIKYNSNNSAICFARRMPINSGLLDNCWSFNTKLLFAEDPPFQLQVTSFYINYAFKNKQGQIISRIKNRLLSYAYGDSLVKQGVIDHASTNNPNSIWEAGNPPNILANNFYKQNPRCGAFFVLLTDGTYNLNETLEIDNDLLKEVSSIEVSFDPIKFK